MLSERVQTADGSTVAEGVADGGEFDDFFAEHRQRLVFSLWLITGNRDEAEEIAQDAFVKALERWDRIRTLARPDGYLYRTGINLARNRVRHLARAMRIGVRLAPPSDDTAAVDASDAISRWLENLTRSQRAAVVLVDLLAFTSEEAAEAMGIRASTVRVHLARARAGLRERIGEDDD